MGHLVLDRLKKTRGGNRWIWCDVDGSRSAHASLSNHAALIYSDNTRGGGRCMESGFTRTQNMYLLTYLSNKHLLHLLLAIRTPTSPASLAKSMLDKLFSFSKLPALSQYLPAYIVVSNTGRILGVTTRSVPSREHRTLIEIALGQASRGQGCLCTAPNLWRPSLPTRPPA